MPRNTNFGNTNMASATLTSSRPDSPANSPKSKSVSDATPVGRALPADLVAALTLPSDRRAFVRYPCRMETSCAPLTSGAGATWTASVCNISRGGLALLLNRRFEPKTILNIALSEPKENCPPNFLVRVAYVTKDASGDWSHGCEFMSKLGDEEVLSML